MQSVVIFLVSSLAILGAPGPTNTLLVIGAASGGARRAGILVPAAIAGYLVALALLLWIVLPLGSELTGFATTLRLLCGVYLIYAAFALWRSDTTLQVTRVVGPRSVFVTTLLNPKAILIATVVIPHASSSIRVAVLWLIVGGLCAVTSVGWVVAGAILREGLGAQAIGRGVRWVGAAALAGFGAAMILLIFLPV